MKLRTNLWIDLAILAAFLVAGQPRLTGESLHEWLGLGLGLFILIHLLLHWNWIQQVVLRFFKNLFHTSRLKFLVDVFLFIAFTGLMMSGVMISHSVLPWLGITLASGGAWKAVHSLLANVTLVLAAVHFALSWNWVKTMSRRYLAAPLAGLFKPRRSLAVVPAENRDTLR
ncbi:MAG: DUF4405 domain-containing protein [Chloroflexi bacterium]|nr:DUF4405 domain-containing protein [Anaerolineaceae bacterium]NMB90797.1 DUF4405 domain-containing protein [Chloroflexota bacterium]